MTSSAFPETVVVDNAWRQVGVSYQDACEDAGISVEWAPVRNPEWKAFIETFWQTLNRLLIHKLSGGVPFGPEMMRKLGLDPAKTATLTLSEIEELIYQAIFEVYPQAAAPRDHARPLAAWHEGLAQGREDHRRRRCARRRVRHGRERDLDRQGIRFKGFRFHDPVITEQLLADLAPGTPVRGRRKRLSSASVRVKIKYMKASIAEIQVWNPKAKPRARYVSLPNWDQAYAALPGIGFSHHERIQAWADANNLPFGTDEDRVLAHDSLRAATENAAPEAKLGSDAPAAAAARTDRARGAAGDRRRARRGRPPGDAAPQVIRPAGRDGGARTGRRRHPREGA